MGAPRALDGDLDGLERVDIGAHEFGHTALEVTGAVQPGATLGLSAAGTPGMAVEVWIGAVPTALPDPPFGTRFFDTKRQRRIAVGTNPLTGSYKLPDNVPVGLTLVFQARAIGPTGTLGTWSNAIHALVE